MKESMWGYLIISLGIVIIAVILLVQRFTSTNEQDYFLSREVMQGAMVDAIDYGSYRTSGKLVMSKEKFVSIFTRRFAESVPADRTYQLDFYDIHEYPPKATVKISTKTGETVIKDDALDLDINTYISGILETRSKLYDETDEGQWKLESSGSSTADQKWTFTRNGVKLTGLQKLTTGKNSKSWYYYYFDGNGIMQVGWVKYDGAYHLFSPIDRGNDGQIDGRRIQSRNAGEYLKVTVNDKTFYIDSKGTCYKKSGDNYKQCTDNDVKNTGTTLTLSDWSYYSCNGNECN